MQVPKLELCSGYLNYGRTHVFLTVAKSTVLSRYWQKDKLAFIPKHRTFGVPCMPQLPTTGSWSHSYSATTCRCIGEFFGHLRIYTDCCNSCFATTWVGNSTIVQPSSPYCQAPCWFLHFYRPGTTKTKL